MTWLSFIILCHIFGVTESDLCNGVEYIHGKWAEETSLLQDPSQNFLCCGGIRSVQNLNLFLHNNPNITNLCKRNIDTFDHGCNCMSHHMKEKYDIPVKYAFLEANDNKFKYNPKSVTYKWQTSTCELPNWNATKFCQALGSKKVLIIGDSTSYQIAMTLNTMIAQTNFSDRSLHRCERQIHFQWSDRLFEKSGRGASMAEVIESEGKLGNFYDIIIFGNFHGASHGTSGFNYSFSDPKFADGILLKLSQNLSQIRKFYHTQNLKEPILIYKNLSLPHSNCGNHYDREAILTESTGAYENMSIQLEKINSQGLGAKYNWIGESILDRGIFETLSYKDNISIIRMFPLIYRPDGHSPSHKEDCLHYCMPG